MRSQEVNESGMDGNLESTVSKLNRYALSKGASSTKLISVKDIVVSDWVRLKCMYGCNGYGKCFTCPPYTPTPEETRRILSEYRYAILIEFRNVKGSKELKSIHELMLELEKIAFLEGYYKAFAFIADVCMMCEKCPAEDLKYPSKCDKKFCVYPEKARPSMQSCGIDVFATVRKAGYSLDVVVAAERGFKSFTLLLID